METNFANGFDVNEDVNNILDDGNINDDHNIDGGNDESNLLKDFDAVLRDVDFSRLSNSSALENKLQRMLLRWRQGDYQKMPSSLFLAYFLQKKYDLSAGKPALVGQDAHRLSLINAVAEDLGYVVFLADYERLVIRQNHHLQGLVSKTTINISRIVDVNGKSISGEPILKSQLDSVIEPEGLEPDDVWTIEGIYVWLDSTVSRHWFRGTVLLLVHGDDVEDILIAPMEAQDALLELQCCSAASYPTAKTKKLVRHIFKRLAGDFATARSVFSSLAELALKWRDLDLWNQLVAFSDKDRDARLLHASLLKRSCQAFGFSVVRPSLELMLSSSTLGEAATFLNDMPSYLSQFEDMAELDEWYKIQVINKLRVGGYWNNGDISHLMTIARTFGIRYLFVVPLDVQEHEWECVLDFAESLQNNRQSILSLPVNQTAFDDVLEETIDSSRPLDQIINDLIHRLVYQVFKQATRNLQWYATGYLRDPCFGEIQISLTCIWLFTITGKNCQGILQEILDLPSEDETFKLREIYIPLVRRLCPLIRQSEYTVYSPTFGPFIRHVVELYSRLLLGSRTYNPQFKPLLRVIEEKFTCDCRDCINLGNFLRQLYVPERTFIVSRTGMHHFIPYIMAVPKLVRYKEMQSPHGYCIKVIKSAAFSEHRWDVRVGRFKDFLLSIGDEDVIEKLMGDRCVDLKKSLES